MGVILGKNSTIQVLGKSVDFTMTFGKILVFHKVLHVPNIKKNLINESFLVSRGYKIILEYNKLVITHYNKFVGICFVSKGLFKLSVIPKYSNQDHLFILNLESLNV